MDSGVSGWELDRLITPKDMSKYLKGSWQAGMMNTVAPFYMAPEVADTGKGTCTGDIFSLGIVCAEIWLQKLPGSDQGETRLETKLYEPPMSLTMMRHRVVVCNSFTTHALQAQAHTVPTSVLAKHKQKLHLHGAPQELQSLVQRMLDGDPTKRPSLEEITDELQRIFDAMPDLPHEPAIQMVVPSFMKVQPVGERPSTTAETSTEAPTTA